MIYMFYFAKKSKLAHEKVSAHTWLKIRGTLYGPHGNTLVHLKICSFYDSLTQKRFRLLLYTNVNKPYSTIKAQLKSKVTEA